MNLFSDFLQEQFDKFLLFIKSIVADEQWIKIDEQISDIKNNKWKIYIFIFSLNENNKEKHVQEFVNLYKIDCIHKQKILDFYDLFIQSKNLLNS